MAWFGYGTGMVWLSMACMGIVRVLSGYGMVMVWVWYGMVMIWVWYGYDMSMGISVSTGIVLVWYGMVWYGYSIGMVPH